MAKWGEGDPRWIVEERPDATNVNNWHWTEKNADSWSKKKLRSLFSGLIVQDSFGQINIEEVEKVEGEARANNRKAKLIFFYEWVLTLKWYGVLAGSEVIVNGKVEIPNLSEEHENMEDVDIDVSVSTSGSESETLKEILRNGIGARALRVKLNEYVNALREEFAPSLLLPNKSSSLESQKNEKSDSFSKNNVLSSFSSSSTPYNKYESGTILTEKKSEEKLMETLRLEDSFKCTGSELYNVLTNKQMMSIFTRGDVVMDSEGAEVGMNFTLLGGNIQGTFLELIPYTKIRQSWRLKTWPPSVISTVSLSLEERKDSVLLKLEQRGVPASEVENTKEGWRRYYWESIKRVFGYGSVLF